MRIVSFFVRSILTMAIIAGIVYFIGGQIWMAVALRSFFTNIQVLENAVTDTARNARLCQNAPASSSYSSPKAVQLRFLDGQNYAVEVVCTLIESTPVSLAQGKLPMFITKEPGSSGFYWDLENPEASSFTLRSLRATKKFVFDEKLLAAGAKVPELSTRSLPVTACTGFGYQCCQKATQKGQGAAQTSGVTDCPGECFSMCRSIPSVVALTSDPYPSNSEVVMTNTTETVTFSYTTTYPGGKVAKVKMEYGDGTTDESMEAIGIFTHTYTCIGPCRYKAQIRVFDAEGNSSVESDVSTLYIVRR